MDATEARTAIYHLSEASRIAEAAYEETLGEETPEISAIEHLQNLVAKDAAEALSSLVGSVRATRAALKLEIDRLTKRVSEIGASEDWAIAQLGEILEATGKKKMPAGTFTVAKKRGSERVVIPEGFDVRSLPAECLRHKPETWEVAKVETKKWIKSNPDEDHGGVTVERGPDSVSVK